MTPEPAIVCPACEAPMTSAAPGQPRVCLTCGEQFKPRKHVVDRASIVHGMRAAKLRRCGLPVTLPEISRTEAETLADLIQSKLTAMDVIDREDERVQRVLASLDQKLRRAMTPAKAAA